MPDPNLEPLLQGFDARDHEGRMALARKLMEQSKNSPSVRSAINDAFALEGIAEKEGIKGQALYSFLRSTDEALKKGGVDALVALGEPEHLARGKDFKVEPGYFSLSAPERVKRVLEAHKTKQPRLTMGEPLTPLEATLGSASTGMGRAIASLPGLGKLRGTPEGDERFLQKSRESIGGFATKTAELGGELAPIVFGAGPLMKTGTALGSIASGAAIGGAFTPGEMSDRLVGAALGGASFGLAHGAQRGAAQALRSLQQRLVETPTLARFLPVASRALLDSGAFTVVAATEQEWRNPVDPASFGELFVANLGMVSMAMGMSARRPPPGARFAQGREKVGLRRTFEEGGPIQRTLTRDALIESGMDPVAVEAAYRASLRGLRPEEVGALLKKGPEGLRVLVTPERAAEIFAPDLAEANKRIERVIDTEFEPSQVARLDRHAGVIAAKRQTGATKDFREVAALRAKAAELRGKADATPERVEQQVEAVMGPDVTDIVGSRPLEPKPTRPRTEQAAGVRSKGAERAAALRAQADAIEARADAMQVRAETRIDRRTEHLKKVAGERDRLIAESPIHDIIAKTMPKDSIGSRILADGTVEEANRVFRQNGLARTTPMPTQRIQPSDAFTEVGMRQMKMALDEVPPSAPAASLAKLHAHDEPRMPVGPSRLSDRFRGIVNTFPRIFGAERAAKLKSVMRHAVWKQAQMSGRMRTRFMDAFKRYDVWLRTLPDAEHAASADRLIGLHEGGVRSGVHPIETEMLNAMHQVFGRYRRVLKAMGRPVLSEPYFPHIFETIHLTGDAAKDSAIVASLLGPSPGEGGGAGSKFLRRRATDRTDFSRDLAFVADAYINSVSRWIYWEPVKRYVDSELRPQVEADTNTFLRANTKDLKLNITTVDSDSPAAKKAKAIVESAFDLVNRHIEVGLGKKQITDLVIGKGKAARMARGYVYAQYVGGLGLNPGSALRNLLQQTNTVAEVGPKWLLKGWSQIFVLENGKPRLNPALRRAGIIESGRTADIKALTAGPKALRTARSLARKGADASLVFFQGAETLNRAATYLAARSKALSRGFTEAQARGYAREVVARTQFDYAGGLGGVAYNGPFMHALFQFTRFPIYQTDYIATVARRAMTGDTTGMLPGDKAIAPAFRLAAAAYVASGLMDFTDTEFGEGVGLGGIMEILKLAGTRAVEFGAERHAIARGEPAALAREKARKFARGIGLEPFAMSGTEAVMSAFGPVARQTQTTFDYVFGTDAERSMAKKQFLNRFTTALPGGLAAKRIGRYIAESRDNVVRKYGTGDVMFEISDGDAFLRSLGINTSEVIENYENVRDAKLRDARYSVMKSEMYDDLREMYRDLRNSKDPDAQRKTANKMHDALRVIALDQGVSLATLFAREIEDGTELIDAMVESLKRNVFKRVEEGESKTEIQRLIDRSNILGGKGGR